MAASIIPDLIRDSGAHRDKDHVSITRSFFVKGIDTSVPALVVALAVAAPGIPVYGDPFPNAPYTTLLASNIDVRPVGSHSMAEVIVTYELRLLDGGGSEALVEYDGSMAGDMTNSDKSGTRMDVVYSPTGSSPGQPVPIGVDNSAPSIATIQVLRPVGQLRVTKYYTLGPSDHTIDDMVKAYQGRVNSVDWRGRPKLSWLLSNIHTNLLSAKQFKVQFQFDWKPYFIGDTLSTKRGGWVGDCAYHCPEFDGPGPKFEKWDNIQNGPGAGANGYKMALIYPEVDFNALGF